MITKQAVINETPITVELYNEDNSKVQDFVKRSVDMIYADMLYYNGDFSWVDKVLPLLRIGGAFWIQTDYHTVAEIKLYVEKSGLTLINWIIWPYDWGGRPRDAFGRKHDDILYFSKGTKGRIFNADQIRIEKKTAGTGFDVGGRGKIPTDVWSDIGNFHTMSNERVHGVLWQKPKRLIDRIVLSTTNPGDLVLDPFMGSGTTGISCVDNEVSFIGFEISPSIYEIAQKRIRQYIASRE